MLITYPIRHYYLLLPLMPDFAAYDFSLPPLCFSCRHEMATSPAALFHIIHEYEYLTYINEDEYELRLRFDIFPIAAAADYVDAVDSHCRRGHGAALPRSRVAFSLRRE